jgi:hypothetical protein
MQTAFHIKISSDAEGTALICDSGVVQTNLSNLIECKGDGGSRSTNLTAGETY